MTGKGWARFFCRVELGIIFLMAGWWKTFEMGPQLHATQLFTEPYADTWIPWILLYGSGFSIPFLELVAGLLLVVGWRTREALIVVGGILLLVTYGHLLKEALYSPINHIFPRTILMAIVLSLPAVEDKLAVDWWLSRRGETPASS